ncbi:MAG: crossover junction endodeoxyribonuclease RuvC [Phycisphaerae bacterium]
MANPGQAVRVLGIDPGLNITGYGAVDFVGPRPQLVEAGALRTDPKASLADRIAQLHADLGELLDELKPDTVGLEKLYAHYKHPRTSILMAHARGVLILACCQAELPVRSVAATEVKKSLTGKGHASKQQVQRAIASVFGLAEPPSPPDVADALAIALCAGRRL